MRVLLPLAAVALTISCGGDLVLPDRADDGVRNTEVELAQVVVASRGGGECQVRLLGQADGSSFVWGACRGPVGAISAPMRVDGDDVELPGDGTQYRDDVRRLFPPEIADAILTDQERLRP